MKRRAFLAASAAVPLAGTTAAALPVSASAQPADPVLAVFAEWQEVLRAEGKALDAYAEVEARRGPRDEELAHYQKHVIPAHDRRDAVQARLAQITPATLTGLAAQLEVALEGGHLIDPARYEADDSICLSAHLLISMLAGARRMAGALTA